MSIPELTVTALGTRYSGKSTFLLGMFDVLSTGLHGYFTFTEDPDDGVDLQDAWDLLMDEGQVPDPTTQNKCYRFVFNHGLTPLVTIDWMDYRGAALDDRGDSSPDVAELRERLNGSDSIYLVLDGGTLAEWLDDPKRLSVVQRRLKVQAMSALVLTAVRHRMEQDLPMPSLVVVITKSDLLRAPGRTVAQALSAVVRDLPTLLPVVFAKGVTALVCPVKVGDFGKDSAVPIAVEDIDPVGLHRPMVFSLMRHLTEGLGARKVKIDGAESQRSAVTQQLAALNQGFLAVFRGRRTAELRDIAAAHQQTIDDQGKRHSADIGLIDALGREIAGHPVIRSGELTL